MNFLAHCLIALKAGNGNSSAHPSALGAKRWSAAENFNPQAVEPAGKSEPADQSPSSFKPSTSIATENANGLDNRLAGTVELTDGLVAGGLLGDFVKGPVPCAWPAALQLGVRLHRRIDAYSNTAPELRRSCARFPPELRRFAPIFIDIIADHCLALDWADHHHEALPAFSARCYGMAAAEANRLDGKGRRYLNWLIKQDLLAGYRHRGVMERGLLSVTRRLARQHLDGSLLNFVEGALPCLQADFRDYFPLLVRHAEHWVQGRHGPS